MGRQKSNGIYRAFNHMSCVLFYRTGYINNVVVTESTKEDLEISVNREVHSTASSSL